MRVELKNVSRPYQQIAGGTTIQTITGYGPFRYDLYFDPSYVDSRDRYQLVGSVTNSFGQTLLEGLWTYLRRGWTTAQLRPDHATAWGDYGQQ